MKASGTFSPRARLTAAALAVALSACSGASKGTGPAGPGSGGGGASDPGLDVPPAKEITSVEGIIEYRLDNGLQVLLFPDESQARVTVNVTYFVGSRHEGYGEAGMAHLLEHMVFKGTPTHKDIWKLLDDRGARFNGTTWTDRTNYYESLPASAENLEFALALEADRMINSSIDPAQLAKEFSVVRNEFEMGENNPFAILEERMYSSAFLWHNYGKSTIGNKSDIERVPATALRRFYEKYYQPDNAVLVVAGSFGKDAALEIIRRHFGAIPRPQRKLEATYTVEPVQDGERHVTLRRVGDVQGFGALFHTVPGSHADFVPIEALIHALTNEPSGRLYRELVKGGHATRVWGAQYAWRDPGVVTLFAELAKDKPLAKVEKAVLSTVESLAKSPITDEEVNRFKARALKDWELAFNDSQRIGIELSEFAAMGDWRLLFVYRDRLEKLSTADVNRVAATYFKRSNRTTGSFVPTKSPNRAPEVGEVEIAALVDGYKGRAGVAKGEAFEASIENVERRTERRDLAGGMKLALLAKKTRGQAVRARLVLHFGTERDLRGKSEVVAMLTEMLMRGTKKRSYQQIKDELDRLKASVAVGGGGLFSMGDNSVTLNIETTRDNLPEVLALVSEIVREPSFPADQFKILKEETLTSLEEQKNNPQVVGFVTLIRAINPWPRGDVRYAPTLDERIAAIKNVKLAELGRFHATFFGAQSAELAVVGDFDPAQITAVLEEKLATWKAKKPFKRIEVPHKAKPGTKHEVNTPDKQMAIIGAAHTIALRDDHPDYAAAEMAGYVLGGGAASRMMNRLRQKDGLSYGAFGAVQASSLDKNGLVVVGAICAPQNVEKAMAAMNEELELLVAKGVEAKELEDAKGAYLKAFKGNLANDGFLVNQLAEGLYLGRTLEFQKKLNERIKTLTPAEVNAAIKKYIKPGQLSRVSAGDLAKTE
jgi:zinc protease